MLSYDFVENTVDKCIYMNISGSKYTIMILYIDDILLVANHVVLLHDIKKILLDKIEIKDMSETSYVIRIEILCNRSQEMLGLSKKC